MTLEEAFTKFAATRSHGLPWEIGADDLRAIFTAGWHAHYEAGRQTDMFPGTLANESRPASLTGENAALVAPKHPFKSDAGLVTAESIYAAYPRKVGKQAAIKAIKKVIRAGKKNEDWMCEQMGAIDTDNDRPMAGPTVETVLLERTKAYAAATASWPAADKQFIPHPATWFNRGSYDDDPKEWVRGAAATPSQFKNTR